MSGRGPGLAWWTLVGVLGGFAVAGMLTIGIFLVPLVLLMVVLGVTVSALANESAAMVLAGPAVPLLWIAHSQSSPGLTDPWDPRPFVAAAVAFVLAAIALYAVLRRTVRGLTRTG